MPVPPPPKFEKNVHTRDTRPSSLENKLVAVKAYRKDMGLCYKCGVKWSKDPKCSPEVLHAIRSGVEERFMRSPIK